MSLHVFSQTIHSITPARPGVFASARDDLRVTARGAAPYRSDKAVASATRPLRRRNGAALGDIAAIRRTAPGSGDNDLVRVRSDFEIRAIATPGHAAHHTLSLGHKVFRLRRLGRSARRRATRRRPGPPDRISMHARIDRQIRRLNPASFTCRLSVCLWAIFPAAPRRARSRFTRWSSGSARIRACDDEQEILQPSPTACAN